MYTALVAGSVAFLSSEEDGVSDHEAGPPLRQAGHGQAQEGTSPGQ